MDRHFALPIAIAAALHAGLLFWNSPTTPAKTPDKDVVPRDPLKNFVEVFIAPPEASEEKFESAKGDPNETRVTTPEPPPVEPTGCVLTVDVPRLPPVNPGHEVTIIGGPPGVESGSLLGTSLIPNGLTTGGDLDSPPRTRVQVPPPFPYDKRKEGISGEVLVEFTVDEAGVVLSPRIVRSSDHAFDEPTLRAITKWRFEPGKRHGRIVPFRMAVPIVFKLDND